MASNKSTPLLKTPLAAAHEALGAKMVEFGGWLMPVQYAGILQEHQAVRAAAGLFDISHMGEFIISGPSAEAWLNSVMTNDIRAISPGHGQYTLMLNEAGGVVDDLFIYRLKDQTYLAVVNASEIDQDFDWLHKRLMANVTLENVSEDYAALALQGPKADAILYKVFVKEIRHIRRNQLMTSRFMGESVLITRTGYTGEDGYEFFCPPAVAAGLWERVLAEGVSLGCVPVGLGARDTLRLEACYPLYGHELSPTISPLEAGVGCFVSFDKPERFVGREKLREQKKAGPPRRSVAFEMSAPSAPPRAGYAVHADGRSAGVVTSGGVSPTLGKNIGLALIDSGHASVGVRLEIEIREKRHPALTVKKPFCCNIQK
ncbi:MAG: glycine cleavage system aminomethyltransferase GcvT [Verrucomicrobiales bacterium]|jgi:aminomethyltransferase|nr:glycine cleavage system aminomethyltransferase GcvT [Verrucomicrobiales bacterium]